VLDKIVRQELAELQLEVGDEASEGGEDDRADWLSRVGPLHLVDGSVHDLVMRDGRVIGAEVKVPDGSLVSLASDAVVLTTGTFLGGRIHYGRESWPGGRMGDSADPCTSPLSATVARAGITTRRFKTGTVPRVDATTLDFSNMQVQEHEPDVRPFSVLADSLPTDRPYLTCHATRTTPAAHALVLAHAHEQPFLDSTPDGRGIAPRYCPSIESKVTRFPDRTHQVWVEPESASTDSIYLSGIAMSLPLDVQTAVVRALPGCESAKLLSPGYYVEYDCIDARALTHTLEAQSTAGLFFAGQVNGTTGYEEAAVQGVVAGVNAGLVALGRPRDFVVSRADGFVGVLIDDLVTRGTDEPYRMFTSRAEYRLSQRADNADLRLTTATPGTSVARRAAATLRGQQVDEALASLRSHVLRRATDFAEVGIRQPADGKPVSLLDAIARGLADHADAFATFLPEPVRASSLSMTTVHCEAVYSYALAKQSQDVAQFRANESLRLPTDLDYSSVSMTTEERERLAAAKPETLGAAARCGLTSSTVVLLMHQVLKQERRNRAM
jgi:tRNA uridine 5-carboxymethylaminomethyl modification enzyme